VLVGEAGRRLQGFLAKVGITSSYVIINTYLYSVYGSVKAKTSKGGALIAYRNRWLDALLVGTNVEGVVALGQAAHKAWDAWTATPNGAAFGGGFAAMTHPTAPESSSNNKKAKLAAATKKMLKNWNAALQTLSPAIVHRDVPTPLKLYGDTWANGDRQPIPEADIPAGLPPWMHENDGWATRTGADALKKRRNITITVPKGIAP